MSATATPQDVLEGRARWCVVEGDCHTQLVCGGRLVDHVISDPPYSQRTSDNARTNKNKAPQSEAHSFISFGGVDAQCEARFLSGCAKRWAVAFCALEQLGDYERGAGASWVRAGVWAKPDGAPQFTGDRPAQSAEGVAIMHAPGRKRWNGGGGRALWTFSVVQSRADFDHPTPKPVDLMLRLIEQFTDPGEVVLDPFCGSGTTGVACLRLGRRFIGIEKDAHYAAVARERLAAEAQGLTLRDARAGQLSLLGETP